MKVYHVYIGRQVLIIFIAYMCTSVYTDFQTMVLLMKELHWNRVAILFEDTTYYRTNANQLQDKASENLICVTKKFPISMSAGGVSLEQINSALDQIMFNDPAIGGFEPVIGGVILFAGKKTANIVLFAMDRKVVEQFPLFILTDTAELTSDVFQFSGKLLPHTKGSMKLSTPYTMISSFSSYWQELVTNIVIFKEHADVNPWLNDMFQSVTGCNPEKSQNCQPLTKDDAKKQFSVQPLHVKYGILAAHTMAKALLQIYDGICMGPLTREHCLAELRSAFKPGSMIEQMKNISINFATDFHERVPIEPLATSHFRMTFGDQAEPVVEEMYEIYNFQQQSVNDSDDLGLVKVSYVLKARVRVRVRVFNTDLVTILYIPGITGE